MKIDTTLLIFNPVVTLTNNRMVYSRIKNRLKMYARRKRFW